MRLLLTLLLFVGALSYAEEQTTPSETPVAPVDVFEPVPETVAEVAKVEKPSPWVGKLISLGARVDAAYTGGGAIAQGFSIPSLRLTAFGEAGEVIDYRLSVSQTREYSSALLPQLIPSEAYMDISTNPPRNGEVRAGSDLRLRIGMCAPTLNPWWTADLADLNIPDYHENHKANFPSRDIGAEVALRPLGENFLFTLGAFNGSGITALNTNNSKAFSGHVHLVLPFSDLKLGLGNGTFYTEQSSPGAINYKRHWVSDFFAYLAYEEARVALLFDTFISEYQDTTRSISPNGYAVMGSLGLFSGVGAFARYETATNSPLKGAIRAYQLGPTLILSDYAKAFIVFQALQLSGTEERAITLRFRVAI